jgi:hypothetical protein
MYFTQDRNLFDVQTTDLFMPAIRWRYSKNLTAQSTKHTRVSLREKNER